MDKLRSMFGGKKQEVKEPAAPAPGAPSNRPVADQAYWRSYCRNCHAVLTLPRRPPPYGTALVCPTCKAPIQTVHEDPPGCPVGSTPQQVQIDFGYVGCSIEHPRCPRCGKVVHAIVFPERGRDVAWYAVEKQENLMSNFTVQVDCPHCNQSFAIEWDEWPFDFNRRKQCNFCGIEVIGDPNPQAIPDDRRAEFEANLGRKASKNAYLRDGNGKPLWYACPSCLNAAVKAKQRADGTDLSKAYSLGAELDAFVDELLAIDRAEGLMNLHKSDAAAYDSRERHKHGREIGQMLALKGGNALMVRVATAFVNRGGTEWRVSHCWHDLKNSSGDICWMA